jgi:hypothetical protein
MPQVDSPFTEDNVQSDPGERHESKAAEVQAYAACSCISSIVRQTAIQASPWL